MKKISYTVVAAWLLTSSIVLAQTPAAKTVTLKGYVVDNACANGNKDKLADFVKSHPKTCLLKGACSSSGYSIYSEELLRNAA